MGKSKRVSAIHIICQRDNASRLKGLSHIGGAHYTSECWAINDTEAQELLGGWVYFHPSKSRRSEFGGVILAVEEGLRPGAATPIGITFTIEARREAHGQTWRGQDHRRAWTGGVVADSLPHEGPHA
jgi:hypothetical protein